MPGQMDRFMMALHINHSYMAKVRGHLGPCLQDPKWLESESLKCGVILGLTRSSWSTTVSTLSPASSYILNLITTRQNHPANTVISNSLMLATGTINLVAMTVARTDKSELNSAMFLPDKLLCTSDVDPMERNTSSLPSRW